MWGINTSSLLGWNICWRGSYPPFFCLFKPAKYILMTPLILHSAFQLLSFILFSRTKNNYSSLFSKDLLFRALRISFLACMLSCVQLFATPWTVACQAPLSVGFPRQEYWSGLPCPLPGDLPNAGIKSMSSASPALAGRFFTTEPRGKPQGFPIKYKI